MKNPFKKKKANRFRGYQPTKKELEEEFDKALQYRVSQRMKAELGENKTFEEFMEFREGNGDRILQEEKNKLISEYGKRGYARIIEYYRQPSETVLLKKVEGGLSE